MEKRILAIDDDEDILEVLHIIFESEGFNLIPLKTGATSDEIRVIHPDLILLDVRIIGFHKTGDIICKELKAEQAVSDIPVVLLSSEADLGYLAGNCGADSYLNKPFDISRLLAKVNELI